jgi:hypothetical protein
MLLRCGFSSGSRSPENENKGRLVTVDLKMKLTSIIKP